MNARDGWGGHRTRRGSRPRRAADRRASSTPGRSSTRRKDERCRAASEEKIEIQCHSERKLGVPIPYLLNSSSEVVKKSTCRTSRATPHPDPLPEGEGERPA